MNERMGFLVQFTQTDNVSKEVYAIKDRAKIDLYLQNNLLDSDLISCKLIRARGIVRYIRGHFMPNMRGRQSVTKN